MLTWYALLIAGAFQRIEDQGIQGSVYEAGFGVQVKLDLSALNDPPNDDNGGATGVLLLEEHRGSVVCIVDVDPVALQESIDFKCHEQSLM